MIIIRPFLCARVLRNVRNNTIMYTRICIPCVCLKSSEDYAPRDRSLHILQLRDACAPCSKLRASSFITRNVGTKQTHVWQERGEKKKIKNKTLTTQILRAVTLDLRSSVNVLTRFITPRNGQKKNNNNYVLVMTVVYEKDLMMCRKKKKILQTAGGCLARCNSTRITHKQRDVIILTSKSRPCFEITSGIRFGTWQFDDNNTLSINSYFFAKVRDVVMGIVFT